MYSIGGLTGRAAELGRYDLTLQASQYYWQLPVNQRLSSFPGSEVLEVRCVSGSGVQHQKTSAEQPTDRHWPSVRQLTTHSSSPVDNTDMQWFTAKLRTSRLMLACLRCTCKAASLYKKS